MSIKVGVRVRPFNKRQQQLSCKSCIEMEVDSSGESKSFVYDYSFWSHDKYMVDPDGVFVPVDEKYADQKKVYEEIGAEILINAWQGYNCCLFAYGQTGSGKSYSMLGYGANQGIIPQVCDQIFSRIRADHNEKHCYEVKVSMLEIYNETLRDLLTRKHVKSELKICEHKKLGVYIEGLQKHSVRNYEQIQREIEEGSKNRSIAATLMNESSSRSHTIVCINFVQRIMVSASTTNVKYSTIYLVDLAGSESVSKTGASGDRLKQAAKINQSLSTLGRVIEILADNATKQEKLFVPYRDSKLTFILRNALGGNSQTAMICAISPADDNYEQTLSTLRYAKRAKKIQNKAVINESDVDKLIRMLREENEMLKTMLKQAKFNKTVINHEIISNVNQMNRNMADLGVLETEFEDMLTDVDSEREKSFEFSYCSQERIFNDTDPYVTNLSEDELLSQRLKYSCAIKLVIGNKNGVPKPDIVLAALGIHAQHAEIVNQDSKIFISCLEQEAGQYTFVNGSAIGSQKIELMNMDRLIFGTGCVFLVKIHEGAIRDKNGIIPQATEIDYTFAINQLHQHQDIQKTPKKSLAEEQQIRKKIIQQIQADYQQIKQSNQQALKSKLQQQETTYNEKLKKIEQIKEQQIIRMKQQLQMQSNEAYKLKQRYAATEKQITHYKQIERQLLESYHDKEELQSAQQTLKQKINDITVLQQSLEQIQTKQNAMQQQIKKKQEMLQKQLQVKLVMCNNQNTLNEYKLQLSKRTKNSNELAELLIRKQKIQLQKQLLQLVPKVQKFNLIAKQMDKQVDCSLSIKYRFFSDGEIIETLKTNTYKNKLRIMIQVFNREEMRSYSWTVQVFNHRFQLSISLFEMFIREPNNPQIHNKETDPYWDTPTLNSVGIAYISLETLFYKLDFEGDIAIVSRGHRVGKLHARIYPCDPKGINDLSKQALSGITIQNPRDLIQKNIYFKMQLNALRLSNSDRYTSLELKYDIYENSIKRTLCKTGPFNPQSFQYTVIHSLMDLSETSISQFIDQPLALTLEGQEIVDDDFMQSRGSFGSITDSTISTNTFTTPMKKQANKQSGSGSGVIVSNFDVMSKIESDYSKKKAEERNKRQASKGRHRPRIRSSKDQCLIF